MFNILNIVHQPILLKSLKNSQNTNPSILLPHAVAWPEFSIQELLGHSIDQHAGHVQDVLVLVIFDFSRLQFSQC